MKELRRLDKVAYVRFASVYRSFEDIAEFEALLKEVGPRKGAAPPLMRLAATIC